MEIKLRPIGHVRTRFAHASGVPSQASVGSEETGEVEIAPELAPALRGLEGFSHAWLVCWFDRLSGEPPPLEVEPNPLRGSGRTFGVFASRSPARPNNVGLSLVRVVEVDGATLRFAGVDLLDGTPVLDVKPYFPEDDAPPGEARTAY